MLVKFYSENGMLMFVLADAQIAKKVQPAIYISKADTTKKMHWKKQNDQNLRENTVRVTRSRILYYMLGEIKCPLFFAS